MGLDPVIRQKTHSVLTDMGVNVKRIWKGILGLREKTKGKTNLESLVLGLLEKL